MTSDLPPRFCAELTTDPWNMSGLQSAMPDQPKRNKTPQEFLGTHSGLVNLDELVKPDNNSKKGSLAYSFACIPVICMKTWHKAIYIKMFVISKVLNKYCNIELMYRQKDGK